MAENAESPAVEQKPLLENPGPPAEVGFEADLKDQTNAEVDFLFDDQKKKKKRKKSIVKPPPKPSKREYESTLMDLNAILADLRKKAIKLDKLNLEYNKKLVETNDRDNDVSEHLALIKAKRAELLTIEEEYNIENTRKLKELQDARKVRISELQDKFQKNEKYLKTDIAILSSKLKTLCQFSGQKDLLIEQMSNVNQIAKEQQRKHQDLLYAQHQKNVVIRNNIANQAKARYARIIDDFTLSREVRNAAYTRRLICENRELRKEYNRQISTNLKTEKELTRFKENAAVVTETYTLTKEITDRLESTQIKRTELLEKLQKSYDNYKLQVVTGSKYRKMYEAVQEHERKESLKLQDEKSLHLAMKAQSSVLFEKYLTLKNVEKEYLSKRKKYDQIMDVIREITPELCNQTEEKAKLENYEEYMGQRSAIIGCLTDIITCDDRPPGSKAMHRAVYYKGYLGMMPLDHAFCNALRNICCKSTDELELVPSFCQRETAFTVEQPPKEQSPAASDPALRCVKNG